MNRFYKIILKILIIFFICTIILLFRKTYIFRKFCKINNEYYSTLTNFYQKIQSNTVEKEIWRKENKAVVKIIENNEIKILYYDDEYIWELENETITKMKKDFIPTIDNCPMYVSNAGEALLASFMIKITTEDLNGINCYKICINKNSILYKFLISKNIQIMDYQLFINKDTWLIVKEILNDSVTDYIRYDFDSVTSTDVQIPNFTNFNFVDMTQ